MEEAGSKLALPRKPTLSSMVLAILLLTPICATLVLIALRSDQVVTFSWCFTILPAWFEEGALIVALLFVRYVLFKKWRQNAHKDEEAQTLSSEPTNTGELLQSELFWWYCTLEVLLLMAFELLLCINIDNQVYSWWFPLSFLFLMVAVHLAHQITLCNKRTYEKWRKTEFYFGLRFPAFVLRRLLVSVLLFVQVILLIIQVQGYATMSWFLVAIPMYLVCIYHGAFVVIDSAFELLSSGLLLREQIIRKLLLSSNQLFFWTFFGVFVYMLAGHLDGHSDFFNVYLVELPFFIALALFVSPLFC